MYSPPRGRAEPPPAHLQLKQLRAWLQAKALRLDQSRLKVDQLLDSPEFLSPHRLTAVTAAESMLQEVIEKMDELAAPETFDYDDLLAAQPGPEQTGELGIVIDDEGEDS